MADSVRFSGRRFGVIVRLAIVLAISVGAPLYAQETAAEESVSEERGTAAQRFRAWRMERIAATDAYLLLTPKATWINLQDTRMTPLVYGGAGFGVALQDLKIQPKLLSVTTLTGGLASLQVPETLPGNYQYITGAADFAYLYRFPDSGESVGGGLAVGGSLSGGTGMRIYDKLQNSSLNFDIIVSLNATARWDLSFEIFNRSLTWFASGRAAVFSYVGRYPEYTIDGVESYWAAPWRFPRMTIETGISTRLRWSDENRVQLTYLWDFYALNEFDGLHNLRVGSHELTVSLATKRM